MALLAGVDLAWKTSRNPTALALGWLGAEGLQVTEIISPLYGRESILESLLALEPLQGIALDAPLILHNAQGRRPCEAELSAVYAARYAGCHPSNLSLYPDADSVYLASQLQLQGFQHLGQPGQTPWQLECYPHPALIECFGLPQRLAYKKGSVEEKRQGQKKLAELLLSLEFSPRLKFTLPAPYRLLLQADSIDLLKGQALKRHEDILDALVCLYVAALYQSQQPVRVFGDLEQGYILVPMGSCI